VPADHDEPSRDGDTASVLQRAAAGDREALGELFRTHQHSLLRFLRGLAVGAAEVAEITGRSPGAVRVLGHRGLNRLRDLLAEDELVAAGGTNGHEPSMD
jgi:DNA-directed RNA polymerase specialized sigma24 family protein